ncbi:GNAT family N-acetyltransferase [Blastococcus litoris]|uniref:GNAT family N-acetyltransferase n=1 Tax=Blastococcus litoris TaxID=2171622 RepID=UPI000E3066B1|nr:GNAT family N-acetyltransferase [Blastococcus litoris]
MRAPLTVDEVAAELTYPLRQAVLRPDGGDVVWAGDEHPATVHLAARTGDRIVGVVRFSPAACPWRSAEHPWQLRGMATDPEVRGSGAGRALVVAGLEAVAARGGDLLWCDARVAAVGFYERMGFTVVTGEFDKPGIGPHRGMLVGITSRSS